MVACARQIRLADPRYRVIDGCKQGWLAVIGKKRDRLEQESCLPWARRQCTRKLSLHMLA